MDSSVTPLRRQQHMVAGHPNLLLVQTVDFFYPLIDDPYVMGQIALANVVSDLYAMGVHEIDSVTMILSAVTEMTDIERDVCLPLMIKGFCDAAQRTGCRAIRPPSQLPNNMWCVLGGWATSVCTHDEIIMFVKY